MMTVFEVTPSVSRLVFGMFESVRHLSRCIHLTKRADVHVLGLFDEKTSEDRKYWQPLDVRTHPVIGPRKFGYAPSMLNALMRGKPDVVHLHGLWQYSSAAVLHWNRRSGKPYVISPRGMLEPWALQQSRLQKRIAGWLFQDACLRHAACIHATSSQEAESVRAAGYTNPIALIPNGIEAPAALRGARMSGHRKAKRALFLSRLHPKKGLLNLIQAWHEVRPIDWELMIAGPDEDGHRREVKRAVEERMLQDCIAFHDEVFGEAKRELYFESDLFILPSFSENFGLVVAEALAHGLPVITTRATPWEIIEQHHCGWWIDVGVQPLACALKEATSLSCEQLREMGSRGREMIRRYYSWDQIADQMIEVYEWSLVGGTAPNCVACL
jgi:glycosyltransferase involved in cell wall biosynthesis